MAGPTPSPSEPWWRRRKPSVLTMAVVLFGIVVATIVMAFKVTEVLPEVARDQLGEDRWAEPMGIERNADFQIGRIPDCAEGPISRIVLWDADSEPYWEVAGEAKPLKAFVVGGPPEGFEEITPYREPPPGEVLRLIAFRTTGGAVGVRYRFDALKSDRVMSGTPLSTFTVDGFQDALVCSDSATSDQLTPDDVDGVTDGSVAGPEGSVDGSTGAPAGPDDPAATMPPG